MYSVSDKNSNRKVRHARVRNKISGTESCPRLNVYRSLSNLFAQIIDDTKGITLVSASTLDKDLLKQLEGKTKTQKAEIIGEIIAKKAIEKNINDVVFDRGGYQYMGRVKAVAEAARQAGLRF